MDWDNEVKAAESLLHFATIPSSEQIICAIKRVNPTRLCLPDGDRERGYDVKNRLQSLLLQHYGEAFQLIPHPCCPDVVLIKHLFLPSIDACHAPLSALSPQALDSVSRRAAEAKGDKPKTPRKKIDLNQPAASLKETLKRARQMLDGYDYAGAEQELAGMRLSADSDTYAFSKGIRMLFEEMGACQTAIDTLQAQPARALQDRSIRELLALAYHGNGSLAEAGAVFDTIHPADLGKDALYAYATLACRDGNHSFALRLVHMAEEKPGFVGGLDALNIEIEKALSAEAEPLQDQAAAAFARGELDLAQTLAQEALKSCRNLPRARRIIALVEHFARQEEIARLWLAVERQPDRKGRIRLLSKLQELDSHNGAGIEQRLQTERDCEHKEEIGARLASLRLALEEERWPDCFDEIIWLSGQVGAGAEYREAVSLSPLFRVLYRNGRLERSSREAAKQAWLHYVDALSLLRAGRHREALPMLQEVHPYFRGDAEFKREHDAALAAEHRAATEQAHRLVEDASAQGRSFSEVAELRAAMRKLLPLLPSDSRSEFAAALDGRLEALRPRKSQDLLVEQYREARLMGNVPKSLSLAGEIADPAVVEAIDAEVEATMKIEAEAIELCLSDTLEVDFQRGDNPLALHWITERHACLKEAPDTIIVIDLKGMTASRLKSHLLPGLHFVDCITETNQFLFIDLDKERYCRAVLDGAHSRFTSIFVVPSDALGGEDLDYEILFMSETKEGEYYLALSDPEENLGHRIARFSINNFRNTPHRCSFQSEIRDINRLAAPDSFAIATEDETMLCSRSLALSTRMKIQARILAVDRSSQVVYLLHNGLLTTHHFDLRPIGGFADALCVWLFPPEALFGLNPESDTAFYLTDSGKGFFYNLGSNMLSGLVSTSSLVFTAIPSAAWYYLEYDRSAASIRLRDISHSLGTLLQWREVFASGQSIEEFSKPLEKLFEGVDIVQEMCDSLKASPGPATAYGQTASESAITVIPSPIRPRP